MRDVAERGIVKRFGKQGRAGEGGAAFQHRRVEAARKMTGPGEERADEPEALRSPVAQGLPGGGGHHEGDAAGAAQTGLVGEVLEKPVPDLLNRKGRVGAAQRGKSGRDGGRVRFQPRPTAPRRGQTAGSDDGKVVHGAAKMRAAFEPPKPRFVLAT